MPNDFSTQLIKKHVTRAARVMHVQTPHGDFTTPCFMPVGTRAAVNCVTPDALRDAGAQIILGGNTYHMLCSPGVARLEHLGGMHAFMGWHGPMLIDSGGFQVYSLSKNKQICKITEAGAIFSNPTSGEKIFLTPASSIAAQKVFGADIVMAFDQCTEDSATKDVAAAAMARTHRWLRASLDFHHADPYSKQNNKQAFFGIVQGGCFEDLRKESAEEIVAAQVDGVAIGGETIGYEMDKTREILSWIEPLLPTTKIRYAMGVGLHPQNLIDVIQLGVDIFDCVAPTRNARHGSLYSGKVVESNGWLKYETEFKDGKLNLNNARFADDNAPICADCPCPTCRNFSRAYLRFLLKSKSLLYHGLATRHNIQVTQDVCSRVRAFVLKHAL